MEEIEMVIKTFCDLCGKEIPSAYGRLRIELIKQDNKNITDWSNTFRQVADLCKPCYILVGKKIG